MQNNGDKQQSSFMGGFVGHTLSIVVSVVVVIYLGYHFFSGFNSDLTTEFAMQITENDVTELNAYIMRNESVVYSTNVGGIGYNYSDGTKINAGATVASIYGSLTNTEATRDKIITIDKEIELLRESSAVEGLIGSDTSTIDNRINSYFLEIRESVENDNYSHLSKRRDQFLTLLNKRQLITGKVDSFDSIIESLNSAKELLTTGLDSVTETVISKVPGFFYSVLDGYESFFTKDAALNITLESFDKLLECEPTEYGPEAVGKIATDFSWYIVVEITRDELRYYNEGYSYDVLFPFNDDIVLNMKLISIIAPDIGERVLLVLSSHEIPENFSFNRMQPVEIIKESFTGYKVPISAVRLKDGKMGVYILVGTTVDFRYIDVILESDGYYIVAPRDVENDPEYYTKLGLYDLIITGGKNLYVGKIIS